MPGKGKKLKKRDVEVVGEESRKGLPVRSLAGIILITLLAAALVYYVWLPPVNLRSRDFWQYLLGLSLLFSVLYYLRAGAFALKKHGGIAFGRKEDLGVFFRLPLVLTVILALAPSLIYFFGSAKLFHARAYSRILTVKEGDISSIPPAEGAESIALMDTASAEKLGNREIGSLSSVVSQYDVSDYTQINYRDTPAKLSPLQYAGFFKWNSNRSKGIPGYVLVDPVSMNADYLSLEKGMRYVPSAYFWEDLARRVRFRYPTAMFENLHFEIDEEGKPWYIADTYDYRIGLFGGKQVTGAILVNPVDGSMACYEAGSIPEWVDVVYPGNLICDQYNNYAQLHDGFWNSIIGQVGCRKVTEYSAEDDSVYSDYGYIAKDGDIWIYTGITSLNSDSSNIGFIMSNERTEETLFITCAGADEFSAMASAEGEVQEKGYRASFPSLILVDGDPTYIMVLKDASGLVKMYAAVNVEQYNKVATAASQEECIAKYQALISGQITQEEATGEGGLTEREEREEGSASDSPDLSGMKEKEVTVDRLQTIDRDGDTWLYLVDGDRNIYSAPYTDVLGMLLVREGDRITILTDGENFRLRE